MELVSAFSEIVSRDLETPERKEVLKADISKRVQGVVLKNSGWLGAVSNDWKECLKTPGKPLEPVRVNFDATQSSIFQ